MDNSSQTKPSSRTESTAETFYLTNEIRDIKNYLRETGETQKVKIQRWAECEARLIEIGKSTINNKSQISTKLRHEAQNDLHWSFYQIEYIREVLPSGYKDHSNDNVGQRAVNHALENLTVIPGDVLQAATDKQLEEAWKVRNADRDHILFEAKNRGLPLVDHEDRGQKTKTELPPELETDYSISFFDVAEQAYEFADNMISIGKKVKQFPPEISKEENREWALKNRAVAEMFYGWNKRLLKSLHDLKWAFNDFEWFKTAVKEENFSKHGAAVKSKVQAVDKDGNPTGEYRPLTRERVGDTKEEIVDDIIGVATSMDIFAWLNNAIDWHHIKGKVAGRIAKRRIKLGPKLSETAFGAT